MTMLSIVPTDHSYRDDCVRAEARAEHAEEELNYLKAEVSTAHHVLDSHVTRSADYRRCGQRLLSLPERIDLLVEEIAKSDDDTLEKYFQQIRANEALVSDIKGLRTALDDLEAENLKLRNRIAELSKKS